MRHSILLPILLFACLTGGAALAQDLAETGPACGYLCSEDGSPLMTAADTPPDTRLVVKIYFGAFAEACGRAIQNGPDWYGPDVYEMTYRPVYAGPDEPESPLRLYRFFCDAGAYNERHVYLTWTPDYGVQPVSFAYPTVTYDYVGEDIDSAVAGIKMTGMTSRRELVNSSFDPETRKVTEWSCWRGLCDASGRGEWVLEGEAFRLLTYDVDPSYDGEVNLFRVADFTDPTSIDISTPIPFEPPTHDGEEE